MSRTYQMFSVATCMIPFVNHDDANRALMGSNMQKQATPILIPEAPLVAPALNRTAARSTGRLIIASEAGEVTHVEARKIIVKNKEGKVEGISPPRIDQNQPKFSVYATAFGLCWRDGEKRRRAR